MAIKTKKIGDSFCAIYEPDEINFKTLKERDKLLGCSDKLAIATFKITRLLDVNELCEIDAEEIRKNINQARAEIDSIEKVLKKNKIIS